jgi:divalent metal cation (Fe/Co/Zn/Cd) transporter
MNQPENNIYYRRAYWLAILTIIFNLAEGLVSVTFGLSDDSLTLFGFGIDSFIETISAIGILVMIRRTRLNPASLRSQFEVNALRLTGYCFFALALLLFISGVYNVAEGVKPQTTLPGLIIALISIVSMIFLIKAKKHTGNQLQSQAIIADANCNLVCIYMSVVLLVSSALYEIFGFAFFDLLGTAGIIWFSVSEGLEALKKAKGMHACCCGRDCDGSAKVIN